MDADELMTIGRFARLSGVSPHALRHYDDVGLLRPHEVDASSGYRRYRRAQIQTGRLIQSLRALGMPIEEVRRILDASTDDEVEKALLRHRRRLEREHNRLEACIRAVDRYLQEGIVMSMVQSGCRPVQIKVAVEDREASVAFYQEAFGFRYEVARRTEHYDASAFVFGDYGRDTFFLLWLLDDPDRFDRPGPANFSLLVDDLDMAHSRALAAGATEVVAPHDAQGMPRSSGVKDPSGNWIGLAQGWTGFTGCRPVQIKLAVEDRESSVAFYQEAFGLPYEVARRTDQHDSSAFVFGDYGQDTFFLLWLLDEPNRFDRPGMSNFSLLVDDVDGVHARALAAGATEVIAPHDAQGMPRSSGVKDLSGNWIGLAQG